MGLVNTLSKRSADKLLLAHPARARKRSSQYIAHAIRGKSANVLFNGGNLSYQSRYVSTLALWLGLATGALAQTTVSTVSSASYTPIVAPDSIASSFGTNLATSTEAATTTPLPTTLAGTSVSITDSASVTVAASLIFVSPTQINFLMPSTMALGKATVSVVSAGGTVQGTVLVSNVSPAFFTANSSGSGVPAAQFILVDSTGVQTFQNAFTGTSPNYTASPVSLSSGSVYLAMWGTGFRRHSANPIIVTVNGTSVPVLYSGVQSQFFGLDQINIGPLPSSLSGAGSANVVVTVDGIPANSLQIAIQ